MNEYDSIESARTMGPIDRLRHYMNYFVNLYGLKRKTFEEFCSEGNIISHDVGENWKQRGFGAQKWVRLSAGSLFHSIYHNIR